MEAVAGRIPVVAAPGSQSLAETRALTAHALSRCRALLIVTPYYTRATSTGPDRYYLEVTPPHELPWMIYQPPGGRRIRFTGYVAELRIVPHSLSDETCRQRPGFVSECLARVGNDLGFLSA
ncbi:MAG: hypothetical protein CM1200mP18_22630 [Gammaproteobacteria bacterium]|nr:MAG: hypothetical protein CM1200mP18_22630 [Gammaproteobacteria bacterium]